MATSSPHGLRLWIWIVWQLTLSLLVYRMQLMLPGDILIFFFLHCIFVVKVITLAMALSRKIYQVSSQSFLRCKTQLHINFQANHVHRWFLGSAFLVGKRNLHTAKGPQQAQHPNPGNFANRSKEEMTEIGRKGGQKGGRARGVGGFHDMDPDKQVRA